MGCRGLPNAFTTGANFDDRCVYRVYAIRIAILMGCCVKQAWLLVTLVFITAAASAAESAQKLITTNYVIATALNEHFYSTECRSLLGGRAPDWQRITEALAYGKTYMTPQELADLSSGKMLKELKQFVADTHNQIVNRQLATFVGTPKEKCSFLSGYYGGQKMAARDLLVNLGIIR